MVITLNQVKAAKEKFIREFYKYPPVNGVGITHDESNQLAVACNLEEGTKPEGYPDEIDGVKVIYRTIGKIELQ